MSLTQLLPLLTPPPLSVKLEGESKTCVAFANRLRQYTLEGTLKAVWFHPTNESPGKEHIHWQKLKKLEGRIPGTPDYVFLWDQGAGCLEFKTLQGRLSPFQKLFASWCNLAQIPYEVVHTPEQALEHLKTWGVLEA